MLSPVLEQELRQQMDALPLSQQRQVLDFARALAATRPQGVPGHSLLSLAGTIEASDLAVIAQAIEDDCEQIDPEEW